LVYFPIVQIGCCFDHLDKIAAAEQKNFDYGLAAGQENLSKSIDNCLHKFLFKVIWHQHTYSVSATDKMLKIKKN